MSFPHARSRAVQLLAKVVSTRWFERDYLGVRLQIATNVLESYVEGELPMPLDEQMRLAAFVIDELPPYVRAAHQLRAQAVAAKAYESHETATHLTAPR